MAKYIDKLDVLLALFTYSGAMCIPHDAYKYIKRKIDELPTTNVIRCGECKWYTSKKCEYYPTEYSDETHWCSLLDVYMLKESFCSEGEIKE